MLIYLKKTIFAWFQNIPNRKYLYVPEQQVGVGLSHGVAEAGFGGGEGTVRGQEAGGAGATGGGNTQLIRTLIHLLPCSIHKLPHSIIIPILLLVTILLYIQFLLLNFFIMIF